MACLNRMHHKLVLINQFRTLSRSFSALANQNKKVNEARKEKFQKFSDENEEML
jgi:hypothetical protein